MRAVGAYPPLPRFHRIPRTIREPRQRLVTGAEPPQRVPTRAILMELWEKGHLRDPRTLGSAACNASLEKLQAQDSNPSQLLGGLSPARHKGQGCLRPW